MTIVEFFGLLRQHWKMAVLIPVVCMALTGIVAYGFMPNQYTANVSMYILSDDNQSNATLYNDLSASQMLANDVSKLFVSDAIKKEAGNATGVPELKGYKVSVKSETTSRILTLSVTGPNAQKTADIANMLVNLVSDKAHEVMDTEAINVIAPVEVPTHSSGPHRLLFVVLAALVGLLIACCVIVLMHVFNSRLQNQEELHEITGLPVLGNVPGLDA